MPQAKAYLGRKETKGVLFPTMTMSGPEQMAMDVMLLNKAIKDSNISFLTVCGATGCNVAFCI